MTARRVLVLTSSYPRFRGDFAGHFVQTEVEHLAREGNRVLVLAGGCPGSPRSLPRPGVQVEFVGGAALFDHPGALARLRQNPWRAWALCEASARAFNLGRRASHQVDRAIVHWLFPCAWPWAVFSLPKSLLLEIVLHGSDLRLLLALPQVARRHLLEGLAQRRTQLRLVSERQRTALLRAGLGSGGLRLVRQARVEPARLELPQERTHCPSERARYRAELRRALGVSSERRVAVVVGRLIPGKRVDTALRAALLVPDLDTYVIGDGPLQATLRARFPAVTFLGALEREQALRWMSAADLLLCASLQEGAPTTIREARLLGTEVVTTDCSDVSAWAESDRGVWVVGNPSTDPSSDPRR